MPKIWNIQPDKVVVTFDELIPAFYKWNTLKNHIQNYKNKSYGIKRLQIGGNGRQLLIDFDSLPSEIQKALGDPRKVDHILERFYKFDGEAFLFFSTYQFGDKSYLKLEHQELYAVTASVLKAVIHLRSARTKERISKGGSLRATKAKPGTSDNLSVSASLCSDAASFNETLRVKHTATHSLPTSEKHFKRALKAFETKGYVSLISSKHKNSNSRKVTGDTLSLLASLFAKDRTKPTATEVHRRYAAFLDRRIEIINNETGELYNPENFEALSDATVKNYMAKWANKIGSHALRSGDRQQYMQQFKPHHSLDRPKFAGSIISIDDRQPPFKALNGKRIWFYNGLDLASYAFICWVHGETKEGIIREFYRQLVRNYADWGFRLPAELECEMSLNSSYKDTFLREGAMFQHVRIEANNARGKRIERAFGSLRYEYEKELKGFIPRPFARSEANQAGAHEAAQIPYEDIVHGCLSAIKDWNNMPHPEQPHMSRWQYLCTMQNQTLKPTNYLAILPHIGDKTATSCRVGIIKFDNSEHLLAENGKISLGENLIRLMKQAEGREVEVYWLRGNNGKMLKALVFISTQYICEAIEKPRYNRAKIEQDAKDHEALTIMSAYVATIEGYGRKQKGAIDDITVIDNRPATPFNDFVMPGLYNNERPERLSGGRLPEPEYEDYVPMPAPERRTLKDRF